MPKKIISTTLILLHLVTFGPMREAFAFSASSATYQLTQGALNAGGIKDRGGSTLKLGLDVIGEPCIGKAQSAGYLLESGLIPTVQSNPPMQTTIILNQSWKENEAKPDAFDLDDYFTADAPLTYTVSGASKITVSIDPAAHKVSFSQGAAWFGTEKVSFSAKDSEGNSVISNEVTLQVEGVDNPPVLDHIPEISVNENELVTVTPHATDLDGDEITYSFTVPLDAEGKWQTDYSSAGSYTVTVTATDNSESKLTGTQQVEITVKNVNRPPVLNAITDITVNEGDLVTVTPSASDPDDDAITFYYEKPLDTTGKWLTDYESAGVHTVKVTASDGIDTVSKDVKITINNTNRAPEAALTLSNYTVFPKVEIAITLSATDPDGDAMAFSLKKDDVEIASGKIKETYNKTTSFTGIGAHKISVTVTDAQGKSIILSKGVDVADPNANRDAINPVMGDFNGDALSDLGLHNSDTGTWQICISKAGVFENALDWLSGFGTSRDWWPVGGDFNGDAKTDIAIYNNTNGELKIALSGGSGFTVQGSWLTASFANYSWQPISGNFNGDKYTDFALYNKDTGEVKVAQGTGTGFSEFTTWITDSGSGYTALGGDFNADSLTDLCLFKKASGELKVAFSNTKAFVDGSNWLSGFGVDKDAMVSDFNNDGLADVGYWDKTDFSWHYAISTGAKFMDKGVWLSAFGTNNDESASTGDFNGDGLTDAAAFDRDEKGINRWRTQKSTNQPADLLTEIDNGIGGKTEVTYTYAAKADNSGLPFPVYVAYKISLVNTFPAERKASYSQEFNYSGGYYDATEREFRGFAKVKVSDPITGNYTETYFYQGKAGEDGALKGQIEKLIAYDGNERKISQAQNIYEVKTAGPKDRFLGFPSLKEQVTTVWEENNSSLSTKDKYTYDNIGNVTEEYSEGDISVTGDEKSAATIYAKAYEAGFNRPLEAALKDKDAKVVSKKAFEYDEKGNLIKDTIFIFNPISATELQSSNTYSYDSFGNLTTSTNVKGQAVITEYETDFYAYPEKVTNSLGHTIRYVYEPKFGAVKSVTDSNGITSSTAYDSLGRVTQVKNGLNQVAVTYSYPDFNTKVTTNAIGLTATEYIDGLGRKYKSVSSGEDGDSARKVVSEAFFNARGLSEKESLAHYLDEEESKISYVRYEYDLRGRVKKTISDFPGTLKDAESSINYIKPLYTETIDPMGHKKGSLKDVFGNIIEVTEFTQGGVYKTKYEYDIQNNLTKTTDSKGNITQIFYDSAGRKLKMVDPDMGAWAYEYDLLGNLIKQTDAKGQVLEFEYDSLNRLTAKRYTLSASPVTLATYLYDDADKPNCIGRLSKVIDQSGSTEFFYDKLGREAKSIKTVDSSQYIVVREYDILDRLTKLTYPDGEIVNYGYDANSGLLENVFSPGPSLLTPRYYIKDITYNAKGQIKVISYGNGTQTTYAYGQDLRLSKIFTDGIGATLQDLNYIFDHNGNLTTLTDNLRTNIRTYFYDDLDRLTEAKNLPSPTGGFTNFNYQYDSIGNMTYKSDTGVMVYGVGAGPHALTSASGTTYKYDANGNMTQGKNKTLTYDTENRLTEVNELGTITSFTYDGDGGRVKKSTVHSQQSTETTYVGALFEIQSVDNNSPKSVVKHIFAGSQRVCSITTDYGLLTTDYNYYHSDHLGSSSIITDQNGKQAQHLEYTPYGTIAQNEGTDLVKHKFTGKELDSTGLYFYGARYYDPEIGRFITADTIVQAPYDPQSLNRYSYCRNNPINLVDPSGLSWKSFWKKVGDFFSNIGKSITQNPGVFAAALVGGIAFGMMGSALVHSFMLPSMSVGGVSIMEGAIMTGIEFGIGGFGAGLASGLASGQNFTGALQNAGYGFAGGFAFGALAGATYTAGLQSWIHGVDSQQINSLQKQAESALSKGNFEEYIQLSREIQLLDATPPGAVLQGKSELAFGVKHSYLVAAKDAQVKAMGFGPAPGWQGAALKIPVPGIVRTESAAILAASKFKILTTDLAKVAAVWNNMDKIQFPIYDLANPQKNCYGWTNKILTESGLPRVNPKDVW